MPLMQINDTFYFIFFNKKKIKNNGLKKAN